MSAAPAEGHSSKQALPIGMRPPFSFPLAEKRMGRARWKRKGTESKLAHLCKFGECGSQLFCSEICFLLRGTGGVRISFSLVHRADSHMKPRDANRTPSASLFAAAPAHLQSRVVRSEAERTGVEMRRFGFALHFALHPQVRGYADLIFGYSATGRGLPDLVGSA